MGDEALAARTYRDGSGWVRCEECHALTTPVHELAVCPKTCIGREVRALREALERLAATVCPTCRRDADARKALEPQP